MFQFPQKGSLQILNFPWIMANSFNLCLDGLVVEFYAIDWILMLYHSQIRGKWNISAFHQVILMIKKNKKYLRQIASKMSNQTKESVITAEPSKSYQ